MRTKKKFDCVAMKRRIQRQLDREDRGLSDEEIRRRRLEWLETSDDPLAKKWRSIPARRTRPHARRAAKA